MSLERNSYKNLKLYCVWSDEIRDVTISVYLYVGRHACGLIGILYVGEWVLVNGICDTCAHINILLFRNS